MRQVMSVFLIVTFAVMMFSMVMPANLHASSDTDPILAAVANLIIPGLGHFLVGSTGGCVKVAVIFWGIVMFGITIDIILNVIGIPTLGLCSACASLGAVVYLWMDTYNLYKDLSDSQTASDKKSDF